MRRRTLTILVAIALGAAGLAACGDSGPGTFDEEGFPFTFEYPGDFEVSDDLDFAQDLGGGADESVAVAADEDDAIILQRFTLNAEVTEKNLTAAQAEIDGLLAQLGSEPPVGEQGETAGFTSIEYEPLALTDPEGGESRLLFLFEGDQEYLINCQSTPDKREEIADACEEMRETLAPVG